jgi:putative transposase
MVTRFIIFALGEFYHVYNRGNGKQIIFKDSADYRRFTELLFLSNSHKPINVRDIKKQEASVFDFDRGDTLVNIGAYCLMPNHFHILITPCVENGLSTFMNKLGTSYSMYFNRRYNRTGTLFEGAFKAEFADYDEYLKYLFSYIHLNPVKLLQSDWKEAGISDATRAMQYLEKYNYSSFTEYDSVTVNSGTSNNENFVERKEAKILNREVFPEYFDTHEDFRKEILEWIQFNPKIAIES